MYKLLELEFLAYLILLSAILFRRLHDALGTFFFYFIKFYDKIFQIEKKKMQM